MAIDISNATTEELTAIHNEVLRNIALQTQGGLAKNLASAHDSHSSSHGKNSIFDLQRQVSEKFRGNP